MEYGYVRDELEKKLRSGSRVSIAAACFSIYAYQELKPQLESCEELKSAGSFIFSASGVRKVCMVQSLRCAGVIN